MKRLGFVVVLMMSTVAFAQKGGPAVFTVDGDTVWGAEFERVFSKNNKKPDVKPSIQELTEYQDLYVRFKLKVKEAYRLGMDTNESFVKELAGYRKQLAQPYLTDKTVTENLIKEAYDRMLYEVEASNLMIHLSPAASPADTLAAWNRINAWKKQIESGKMSFEQITRDSSTDDHGRKNEGRLGYFSAFGMIYPFESKAYNTAVGKISDVFRTQYGYHIVKVTNKRKSRGDLKVAHILIRVNNDSEYEKNKTRIDAIHDRLTKGEDFTSLVKDFSEDFSTRESGGELNWLKSVGGSVPKDFKEAAFALKDGEFSEPVKTELGWHIIKRIKQKDMPKFDEVKETIKFKIGRDSRSELNKEAVLARIKKENKYRVNQANIEKYYGTADSASFLRGWTPGEDQLTNDVLFQIGEEQYTAKQFSNYLKNGQPRKNHETPRGFAKAMFAKYSEARNLAYEENILENKYDDFKYLMQEYRDGILLFELTNKMVWSKASEDTVGLEKYFEANRGNYVWKKRVATKQYICSNKKAAKKVKKMLKAGANEIELQKEVNKDDPLAVKVTYKVYEQGQDEKIDGIDWSKKLHKIKDKSTNNITYIQIDSTMAPGQKELDETLGPVTSDFQNYLEDKWIQELKLKYPVVIFNGRLEQLFADKK
ncbi:MAG: peptidylprolyl isomerase [Bacteroidia bacterium]|nr:peptidylprolyl isomerase [Bacteroidia bacterium]